MNCLISHPCLIRGGSCSGIKQVAPDPAVLPQEGQEGTRGGPSAGGLSQWGGKPGGGIAEAGRPWAVLTVGCAFSCKAVLSCHLRRVGRWTPQSVSTSCGRSLWRRHSWEKDLRRRGPSQGPPSGIVRVGLRSNTGILRSQSRGQSPGRREPSGAGRGRKGPSLRPPEGMRPCPHLTLDFWPPALGERTLLWFDTPWGRHRSHRNPTRRPSFQSIG